MVLQIKDSKIGGIVISNKITFRMEQNFAICKRYRCRPRTKSFYLVSRYWLGVVPVILLNILIK